MQSQKKKAVIMARKPDSILDLVLTQIRKSTKSLKHKYRSVDTTLNFSELDASLLEEIGFTLFDSLSRNASRAYIRIWHDRWVWVNFCRPGKNSGWIFNSSFEGRLSGAKTPGELIETFIKSTDKIFYSETISPETRLIWENILLNGPKK